MNSSAFSFSHHFLTQQTLLTAIEANDNESVLRCICAIWQNWPDNEQREPLEYHLLSKEELVGKGREQLEAQKYRFIESESLGFVIERNDGSRWVANDPFSIA